MVPLALLKSAAARLNGAAAAIHVRGKVTSSVAQQPNQSLGQTPQKAPDPNACQQMLVRYQQVLGELQKLDEDLRQQVETMQAAQGQAKVDAIARVMASIVEQRTRQRDRMMSLHMQTIGHLAEHSGPDGKLMQCPMLQKLSGSPGGVVSR